MTEYIPQRGEAIWINFNPQAGHEQAGRRPAIVISPKAYNGKVGLVIICPISSRVKGYPFEVRIPDKLPIHGVVLADQVKSMDWKARNVQRICRLPNKVLTEVLKKLNLLIPIP